MTVEITTTGFDEMSRALGNAEKLFQPLGSLAMLKSLEAVKEVIGVYPAQPDRNRAKSFNTYVRGVGNYPKSAFIQDAAAAGGYKMRKGVKRGQIRHTSQQMSRRFSISVAPSETAIDGHLKNAAKYSSYVIGRNEGVQEQVAWHAQTGWSSTEQAIRKAMPQIQQYCDDAINELIRKIKSG